MMSHDLSWPVVLRTFHLPGGLRVIETAPGKAMFGPLHGDGIELEFANYGDVGNEVRDRIKLPINGVEFCKDQQELDGFSQPEWRSVMPKTPNTWPTNVAELNWSGLSNAARERGDSHLFLLAGSIASQCRFSAMRLLDLSNLYTKMIQSVLKYRGDMSEHLFRGYFSDNIFSSIHAAFFEMATLRDYIAEYISFVVYNNSKDDSIDKLNKTIQKRGVRTELEIEIDAIYENSTGWISQFSNRRNTLAHRMPFDRLAGSGLFHVRKHEIKTGEVAWLLHIPVPEPVPKNHKINFKLSTDPNKQIIDQISEINLASSREDTLSYLFHTFRRFVDFGNKLQSTFPYAPEMVTLTEKDIVSFKILD